MARETNADTDYFNTSTAFRNAFPITVSAWIYCTELPSTKGGEETVWSEDGGTTRFFNLRIDDGNPDQPQWNVRGTGGLAVTTVATAISVNTWHHLCGISAASNDHACFLDGGNKATSTGDVGTPQNTDTSIMHLPPFNGDVFRGRVAHVAVWDVALTDAEAASLARGVSPLRIRPKNLVAYYPLFASEGGAAKDYSGKNNDIAEVGTVGVADDAPVMPPFAFYPAGWPGAFTEAAGGGIAAAVAIYHQRYHNLAV